MAKTNNTAKSLEIPIYFHNYKLLEDKEFVLKGSNIYFIQGPNKVGKTSFLKALQSLMIAQDDTPDKVTRGSESAEGSYSTTIPAADGSLLTITHEFTADGKGKFFAVREDGTKISQVTEIRRLFNYTPINVSEFFAMSNSAEGRRKQRDIILKLLSDEERTAFNESDLQEQHYYEQRTGFNNLATTAENSMNAIVLNKEDEALIPREKEAKELILKYKAIQTSRSFVEPNKKSINDLTERKTKLEKEIEDKKVDLKKVEDLITEGNKLIEENDKLLKPYEKVTDDELAGKLEKGEEIITKITSLGTKTTLRAEWKVKMDENKKKSEELTKKISACRDGKADIVSGSDLPVENIDFEDGYLTIDGFQFKENQICESDAVLILANILAKINPGPIQIIGDASILDAEKLEMLNKIAEDNNKVMFVDEVVRNANDMVVVGYEDLVKADLEDNFKKLDGKKKKIVKKIGIEKEFDGVQGNHGTDRSNYIPGTNPKNEDKAPETGENEEPSTLF
jgi:energy-coupling factor transporter ATP-binding protein EcfA2